MILYTQFKVVLDRFHPPQADGISKAQCQNLSGLSEPRIEDCD